MSTVTRSALTAWLVDHGLTELGGKATSHRRFRHDPAGVITVPGHGRQNLSQKHIRMIVRQLEIAAFDRPERARPAPSHLLGGPKAITLPDAWRPATLA